MLLQAWDMSRARRRRPFSAQTHKMQDSKAYFPLIKWPRISIRCYYYHPISVFCCCYALQPRAISRPIVLPRNGSFGSLRALISWQHLYCVPRACWMELCRVVFHPCPSTFRRLRVFCERRGAKGDSDLGINAIYGSIHFEYSQFSQHLFWVQFGATGDYR